MIKSAVSHCICLNHHFYITHAPDPLPLFKSAVNRNNQETKVGEITCPTSVIVVDRLAVILYLYSALEMCGCSCKRSSIQEQTNIPPTPCVTHIAHYMQFTIH